MGGCFSGMVPSGVSDCSWSGRASLGEVELSASVVGFSLAVLSVLVELGVVGASLVETSIQSARLSLPLFMRSNVRREAFSENFKNAAGLTKKSRTVLVSRPPITTTATG